MPRPNRPKVDDGLSFPTSQRLRCLRFLASQTPTIINFLSVNTFLAILIFFGISKLPQLNFRPCTRFSRLSCVLWKRGLSVGTAIYI
jgi:hypothetical protein